MRLGSQRVPSLPCTCLVLALLANAAPLHAQKGVEEPRAGLEFKPPKGWVELPAGGDRGATVRLYCAPRAVAGKEVTHTPLMRVMFFGKGGDTSKDVVADLPRRTPFRGLEDFARRGLAAKDLKSEAFKAGAIEGKRWTVGNLSGERMLMAFSTLIDDGEVAVCFEVVELQADKLDKDFDKTFASLAAVPRVAAKPIEPPWQGDADWAKKDEAMRAAARAKWAADLVAATVAAPEAGFKTGKAKYWTVLSAADPAFTKKAVAAAEVARTWCAEAMPELAKAEPMPAILRIFDNPDQYRAFLTTDPDQREYHAHRRELFFVNDKDNGGNTGYGMLFRAVLWHVFSDVDHGVLPALPRWFDNGCWEFLRSTRLDGKKIKFIVGDVEKGRIEYQLRAKQMPAIWDLMQEHIQPSPEGGETEKVWGYTPECSRLMRWFWIDDGLKAWGKPTLIGDYVRGLGAAHAKIGPDPSLDIEVVGLSEAQVKERNKIYYTWRDAMLVAINDIATPLQPDAWKVINDKWVTYNENYK